MRASKTGTSLPGLREAAFSVADSEIAIIVGRLERAPDSAVMAPGCAVVDLLSAGDALAHIRLPADPSVARLMLDQGCLLVLEVNDRGEFVRSRKVLLSSISCGSAQT